MISAKQRAEYLNNIANIIIAGRNQGATMNKETICKDCEEAIDYNIDERCEACHENYMEYLHERAHYLDYYMD